MDDDGLKVILNLVKAHLNFQVSSWKQVENMKIELTDGRWTTDDQKSSLELSAHILRKSLKQDFSSHIYIFILVLFIDKMSTLEGYWYFYAETTLNVENATYCSCFSVYHAAIDGYL